MRKARIAPVLIKEITRRIGLKRFWQASYTARQLLPIPIATFKNFHKALNVKKLITIGFQSYKKSHLSRLLKLNKLPKET